MGRQGRVRLAFELMLAHSIYMHVLVALVVAEEFSVGLENSTAVFCFLVGFSTTIPLLPGRHSLSRPMGPAPWLPDHLHCTDLVGILGVSFFEATGGVVGASVIFVVLELVATGLNRRGPLLRLIV